MSDKKDYLTHILVVIDPRDTDRIRFMAAEFASGTGVGGRSMQISRWIIVSKNQPWLRVVCAAFADFVRPETLDLLVASHSKVVGAIEDGVNAVWVTPDKIIGA